MNCKVLFVGNILSGDDGIAPIILQHIKGDARLKDLELVEAGIMGVSLVPYAQDADKVIFVDAIQAATKPGTVLHISQKHIQEFIGISSAHDIGLEQVLTMLKTLSPQTHIEVIGIVVEHADAFAQGLSPQLEDQLETITEQTVKLILELVGEDSA